MKKNRDTYHSWYNMKRRCFDKTFKYYHNYGGRGITVCDRWLTFCNFLEDMGEKPENLTIERINNNGNYELPNCKWATRTEQNKNRRKPKISNRLGTKHSEKTKEKLKAKWKQRKEAGYKPPPYTEERRRKVSEANRRRIVVHSYWAKNYDSCVSCKTTQRKHVGKGLCCNCRSRLMMSYHRRIS